MTEGTIKSFDPFAYKVNNISDFDNKVVQAHRSKDQQKIKEILTDDNKKVFNVYICVNSGWHAFVLCIPFNEEPGDTFGLMNDMPVNDPFAVPDRALLWMFELTFENEELKMYKLKMDFHLFKDVKSRIKRSYFIGQYQDVNPYALQFAALRASPNRYSVLLEDCVGFAKEFCVCLLSYCSNYRELEKQVESSIKSATASGLSIEQLSRRIQSSARLGNTFLSGLDMSSYLGGRAGTPIVILFVLVYPVIVSFIVAITVAYLVQNIKSATASGLSIEQLSRRIQSSARLGNTFLSGLDMSSYLGGRAGTPIVILFVLVYPVIVSFIVAITVAYLVQK